MLNGFITAFRTLSIIPLPGKDAPDHAASLPWFPFVGFTLGSLCWAIVRLFERLGTMHPWPEGCALAGVACTILLTKGIHLDGLADWADAFIGRRWNKEKTLEIMKDPHCGVFGALSVMIMILAKWVCLTRLVINGMLTWMICSTVISRTMQVELAASLPYARSESGTAAQFVSNARTRHRIIAWAVALCLLFALSGVAGGVGVLLGWLICRAFGYWCMIRIGGVTGDTLGACSEIVETSILFTAAFLGHISFFFNHGFLHEILR